MVPCTRNSPPIYSYTRAGAFFNGLLADNELPAFLDSFLSVPQVIIQEWLVGGGGEPRSGGESTRCAVILVLWIHWCLKWLKK